MRRRCLLLTLLTALPFCPVPFSKAKVDGDWVELARLDVGLPGGKTVLPVVIEGVFRFEERPLDNGLMQMIFHLDRWRIRMDRSRRGIGEPPGREKGLAEKMADRSEPYGGQHAMLPEPVAA